MCHGASCGQFTRKMFCCNEQGATGSGRVEHPTNKLHSPLSLSSRRALLYADVKKENEGISSTATAMFKRFYINRKIPKSSLHFLNSFLGLFCIFSGGENTRFPPFPYQSKQIYQPPLPLSTRVNYRRWVARPFQRKCYIRSLTDAADSTGSLMDTSVLGPWPRYSEWGRRQKSVNLWSLLPPPVLGVPWPRRRGK